MGREEAVADVRKQMENKKASLKETKESTTVARPSKRKRDAVAPPVQESFFNGDQLSEKRFCTGEDAEILHNSFILADLPTNMAAIYTRAVRRLLPQHQGDIPEADIIEETDGATLTFETPNKTVAAAMFKRLQNARMYGRRWKVQYYPLRAVQCAKEASLVDARLVPAAPRALALRALGGVQGFLTLLDADDVEGDGGERPDSQKRQKKNKGRCDVGGDRSRNCGSSNGSGGNGDGGAGAAADGVWAGDVVERVVASFVDEGSALHARAVLSGRLIGTSGVRLFLQRRCL